MFGVIGLTDGLVLIELMTEREVVTHEYFIN